MSSIFMNAIHVLLNNFRFNALFRLGSNTENSPLLFMLDGKPKIVNGLKNI